METVPSSPLRHRVVEAFRARFRREPTAIARAPGRVDLLGAHVDYNEGWVLPVAIDRHVLVAASPASGTRTRVLALDRDGEGAFDLADVRKSAAPRPGAPDWLAYPAGVAWALMHAGHRIRGMDAVFAGDLPIGAGMSSSAAVETAFLLAWESVCGIALTRRARAELGQRAENEYVGVACGIMDQFTSVHGKADHAVLLDCRSLDHELVPVPPDAAILVADSGVRRELAGSEFNTRKRECEEAVAWLRRSLPRVRALRDVSPEELERHADGMPEIPRRRARHIVGECARVLDGVRALRSGDAAAFGRAMRLSHESSRDLYEVSLPELDLLAETAWNRPGCRGARVIGAGFGGCVAALADRDAVDDVQAAIRAGFARRFGRVPAVHACRASGGADVQRVTGAR
jgi:galactokinase